MGFVYGDNSRTRYFQIVDDYFAIPAREGQDGAISRTRIDGKTVWEIPSHKCENVHITNIGHKQSDWGLKLEIHLLIDEESWCLSMDAYSGAAFGFYARMENINYFEPCDLWTFKSKEGVRRFGVSQKNKDGEVKPVPYRYSKEEVPSWEKIMRKGKEEWDTSAAFDFYKPKFDQLVKDIAMNGRGKKSVKPDGNEVFEDDDLPFGF